MSIDVKICGITDAAALDAAAEAGASYAGFVFHASSPRFLDIGMALKLVDAAPKHLITVGLFVDPRDDELRNVLRHVPLGMIQLHGGEKPSRVAAIRAMTGLPVMKAFGIAGPADFEPVKDYAGADRFLFDAKPAPETGRKGGNAAAFDWGLLKARAFDKPWMLAGGLTAENLAEAVAASGARGVDVSSGVEDAPGRKSPDKIRAFLAIAGTL